MPSALTDEQAVAIAVRVIALGCASLASLCGDGSPGGYRQPVRAAAIIEDAQVFERFLMELVEVDEGVE